MKTILRLLTLALLITFSQSAYSRPKLFPGYYISLNGDSVQCRIVFRDWAINPKTIAVEVNNTTRNFGPTDIKGFGVYGYGDYRTATVTYHRNPIRGQGLPEEFSDQVDTSDCFLKVVVSGFYSLYSLILPDRPYYFISENNGPALELVYRVKQKNYQISEDEEYKRTLFKLFTTEGIIAGNSNLINHALYNGSDIRQLIVKLNINHPEANRVEEKTGSKRSFQVGLYAGGIFNIFPSAFNGKFATDIKMPASPSFTAGIDVLYTFPNHFKSLALGLSLGYGAYRSVTHQTGTRLFYESANYYESVDYHEQLSMANALVMGDFYILYYLNPLKKVKFYLKGGISLNISVKNERDIQSAYDYTDESVINGLPPVPGSGQGTTIVLYTSSSFTTFNGGIGMATGRSRLEFAYYLPKNINTTEFESPFKINMVSACYYYTLFR